MSNWNRVTSKIQLIAIIGNGIRLITSRIKTNFRAFFESDIYLSLVIPYNFLDLLSEEGTTEWNTKIKSTMESTRISIELISMKAGRHDTDYSVGLNEVATSKWQSKNGLQLSSSYVIYIMNVKWFFFLFTLHPNPKHLYPYHVPTLGVIWMDAAAMKRQICKTFRFAVRRVFFTISLWCHFWGRREYTIVALNFTMAGDLHVQSCMHIYCSFVRFLLCVHYNSLAPKVTAQNCTIFMIASMRNGNGKNERSYQFDIVNVR